MEILPEDLKGSNASFGGLVWVRRRNGSWWPGRILSVDELPAKCLRPKKAGTPIKLLGREEGTVDWYNLEKSKRIKAFRCGEYDDFIERAKASATRSKRRNANAGKYVRREDAILQALELEKFFLTNGNQKFYLSKKNSIMSCMAGDFVKQPKKVKNKRKLVYTTRKSSKPEEVSTHELSQSVVSFEHPEQPLNSGIQCTQKNRWKNPNDSEDDMIEGIRRMKDLQDLGLGTVLTGRSNMDASLKGTRARAPSGRISHNLSDVSPIDNFISSCSSLRSTPMFRACQNLKRRSRRRRTLTKLWVSSNKVNVPLLYRDGIITEDSPSQGITRKSPNDLKSAAKTKLPMDNNSLNCPGTLCEETLLDVQEKNGTTVYEVYPSPSVMRDNFDGGFSNSLVNVPILMGERIAEAKPCTSGKIPPYTAEEQSMNFVQVCLVSQASEGLVEACSTNSVTEANHIVQRIESCNIDLNSKVKRHSRCSSLNRNQSSESPDDDADQSSSCLVSSGVKDGIDDGCDESLTFDNSGQARCGSLTEQSCMYQAQTVPASEKDAPAKDFTSKNRSLQSCNNLNPGYSRFSTQHRGALREALMSTMQVQHSDKLGKVSEIFPKRSLLDLSTRMGVASSVYDVELKVQANYHGQRVPLVSLVSKLNGKAIVGHAIQVDVLGDGSTAALLNDCHLSGRSINLLRNWVNVICKLHEKLDHSAKSHLSKDKKSHISYARSPLLKRKPVAGRRSGFSPRKIRRLSSITVDLEDKENGREFIVEKVRASAVSCIPLRVVFSRLNEALNSSSCPTI